MLVDSETQFALVYCCTEGQRVFLCALPFTASHLVLFTRNGAWSSRASARSNKPLG